MMENISPAPPFTTNISAAPPFTTNISAAPPFTTNISAAPPFTTNITFMPHTDMYYDYYYWNYSYWSWAFSDMVEDLVEKHCHLHISSLSWFGVLLFILLTAFPLNAALTWTLLPRGRTMTPPEVLGLNMCIMNLLYCLVLPLMMFSAFIPVFETLRSMQDGLSVLNLFGSPLLLTCMCLERCVAVVRPIIYLKLNRREYRVLLCSCMWALTLAVSLLSSFKHLLSIMLVLSLLILLFFLLMLLSLLLMLWALYRSGPGGEASGSSMKARALKNIAAVMVPAVLAYSPVVALVVLMSKIKDLQFSTEVCQVLQVLIVFPNFSLFIGPLLYLSRLKQLSSCCC